MTEILIHVPSENVLDNIIPLLNDLKINFTASATRITDLYETNGNSKSKYGLSSEFCISNFSHKIKYFEEGD